MRVDIPRMVLAMMQNVGVAGAADVYTYLRTWKPNSENIGHDMVP